MTDHATSDRVRTPEQQLLYRWNRAASMVGICGSEYHNDPERVFKRVAEIMAKAHEARMELARLRREDTR